MIVPLINPSTEEVLREIATLEPRSVEALVEGAQAAQQSWSHVDLPSRLACLSRFAEALKSERSALAEQMTLEMGKTKKEALAEVDKCVSSCATLSELFPRWLKSHEYSLPSGHSVYVRPLGVILGIMPWNYPLWQVARFAFPALLCGNTVLLKHAPNTWGVADAISNLFKKSFPERVYNNLFVDLPTTERLITDPRVRGVSLTGSRRAGEAVGRLSGQHLKKCVLELGGADAYVILDDADLDLAAQVCTQSRLLNAGQSCIAAKRFIVTKKNAQLFTDGVRERMQAVRVGDPMQSSTDIGPLARRDLLDGLSQQVAQAQAQGAKLEVLAKAPEGKGFYHPVALLTAVQPGQVAFDEELFGPVASIVEAQDEAQAIQWANQSRYGLGGGIFSRDIERARKIAIEELQSGMVWINDFVRSEVGVPFGGIKDSGLGRELGREGCFEFTNIKTIYSSR